MNKNQSRFTILEEVFCEKKRPRLRGNPRDWRAKNHITDGTSASYALQLAFPVPVFWIVYGLTLLPATWFQLDGII